jgi:putative FmdB family regulatory protein
VRNFLWRWGGPGILFLIGFGFDVSGFFGSTVVAYIVWLVAALWLVYLFGLGGSFGGRPTPRRHNQERVYARKAAPDATGTRESATKTWASTPKIPMWMRRTRIYNEGMPLYEYECAECGKVDNLLRAISQRDGVVVCGFCGSERVSCKLRVPFSYRSRVWTEPGEVEPKPEQRGVGQPEEHGGGPYVTFVGCSFEGFATAVKTEGGYGVRAHDVLIKDCQTGLDVEGDIDADGLIIE